MGVERSIITKLNESYVGAFYMIGDKIVSNAVKVSQGATYGDYVNYSSHWDLWRALCKTYPRLDNKNYDYDDFPRGRVVFNKKTRKFIVYLDKSLNNSNDIDKICKAYHLGSSNYEINDKDEHYTHVRRGNSSILRENVLFPGSLEDYIKCDIK